MLAVRAALDALEARDEWELLVECDRVDAFPAPLTGFFPLAMGLVVFFVDVVGAAVVLAG
jgi:hypothetical protein